MSPDPIERALTCVRFSEFCIVLFKMSSNSLEQIEMITTTDPFDEELLLFNEELALTAVADFL